MTPTQRVALWERVNAYAETCGADTSEGSVGADRQRAVVALEAEIEAFERRASAPSWLADAAEALGEVRPEDGAPLALNWTQVIEAIREDREDRDHWKKRAEAAEYALAPYLCPKCSTCLSPQELGHTMCRKCAEKDMAKRLGAGLLDLPADWYDHTPDRGPQ
jgi:hypothetical protein